VISIYNDVRQFLDLSPTSHPFRLSATHLIVKLADRSGQLPRSLFLDDLVVIQDRQHHRQGGYADVYRGSRAGASIAIKKPRIIGRTDTAYKVKVLIFVLASVGTEFYVEALP
jgi:hypothetical protein